VSIFTANGSLSNNLFLYNAYSDTCPGKISDIQFSETLKKLLDSLTTWQYGEVVLPDAASGQGLSPSRQWGQKTVTEQRGYGALFAVQDQILLSITHVAVEFVSEPEISHGVGF
jgi:hypothetical protein